MWASLDLGMDLATHPYLYPGQGGLKNSLALFMARLIFYLFSLSLVGTWVDGAVVDRHYPALKKDTAIGIINVQKRSSSTPASHPPSSYFIFLRHPLQKNFEVCKDVRHPSHGVLSENKTKLNNLVRKKQMPKLNLCVVVENT